MIVLRRGTAADGVPWGTDNHGATGFTAACRSLSILQGKTCIKSPYDLHILAYARWYAGRMATVNPLNWPVLRQVKNRDIFGRGPTAQSPLYKNMSARTTTADKVVQSVCPYCAVGCGQRVYVKDNKVIQIEGDPDSPISRGRLCPKGSASEQLVNAPGRQTKILYRAPKAKEWVSLDRDTAMEMITERYLQARKHHWQDFDDHGHPVRRTMGIAALGGATIDNEENYLAKKLFTATGAIQIENQARI